MIGFENLTGAKNLDNHGIVLQEAIITSLEQSKYVHVMTRQRMNDVLSQLGKKELKPVGEWNNTRVMVNGAHVEHWLNGNKLLEFERWNDEWKKLRESAKWKEYPDYGPARVGHIVLQDHGSVFWFRNIKIKEIR